MVDTAVQKELETKFGIIHNPKPIQYSKEASDIIKVILWYAPNSGSVQSYEDALIFNKSFEDEMFEFFVKELGIDKSNVLLQTKE